MYIVSLFFPGYRNVGGYHAKYCIQQFYKKMQDAGIEPTKWIIGWQRFTIPGMEIESQYSNGLPLPSCVEFKVIPHVMTPLKAFKFLYNSNSIPENETVLFLDFLFFDFPFTKIKNIMDNDSKASASVRVFFQENNSFFYDTLVMFKKNNKNIAFNDKDEFIIKIINSSNTVDDDNGDDNILDLGGLQRKLVTIEEIAILEFYTSKYPNINDASAKIIQYLGGKLNINIDFNSTVSAASELENFVQTSCKSLIVFEKERGEKKEEKKEKHVEKLIEKKPRPRIVF
jgi:hypothetical protein